MKLEFKNVYGFNRNKGKLYTIESDKEHVFVYGQNATGKSTIAKALQVLLNNDEYKGAKSSDENKDYLISVEFDGKKASSCDKESKELKNVFIYNKKYAENIVDYDSSHIGTDVVLLNKLTKQNIDIQEDFHKTIKNLSNDYNTNQKKQFVGTLAYDFFATGKKDRENLNEKYVEVVKKVTSLETIKENFGFLSEDFLGENVVLFKQFKSNLLSINNQIIKSILQKKESSKYEINSVEDMSFYEETLVFLGHYENDKCPICLEPDFNILKIKDEISNSLELIKEEEVFKKLTDLYKKIKQIKDTSILKSECIKVYESIMKSKYDKNEIDNLNTSIDNLLNNHDNIFFEKAINNKEINENLEMYNKNIIEIRNIEKKNEDINSEAFVIKLQEKLNKYFERKFYVNLKLIANKTSDENPGSSKILIEFYEDKENKSKIINIFEVLSESEKNIISLLFFMAMVETSYEKEDFFKCLCVFDDPVDSYDSINKYEIASLINGFCYNDKMNINSLFLSHSVDYMRIWNRTFFKDDKDFKLLTKSEVTNLKNSELYLFDGDYEILMKNLRVKNNKVKYIELNQILALTPIIRELSSYSSKVFRQDNKKDLTVKEKTVNDLSVKLSESVVHYHCKSITIDDLIKSLGEYLNTKIIINAPKEVQSESVEEYLKSVCESLKPQEELEFSQRILYKNILAIIIKAEADQFLVQLIKETTNTNKTDCDIYKGYITLGDKIKKINKDKIPEPKKEIYKKITDMIVILNDFSHSANLYLTPLIDVDINRLFDHCKEALTWNTD